MFLVSSSKAISLAFIATTTSILNLKKAISHPKVIEAAKEAIDKYGYGMSSVRFICGTQDIHKELEKKISEFLGTEDTILYAAAFDANGGVFEPLLGPEDAIISDELNHASIIDGVRLCKAQRFRYKNCDMEDLEKQLIAAKDCRHRMIVTDGAFSMDGSVAPLDEICDLADKYEALVMIDESHCSGFIGKTGRGTHEHFNVMGRIDIITGTLGKALGGVIMILSFLYSPACSISASSFCKTGCRVLYMVLF